MRTIGVIGGMSWQSTGLYYRLLNEGVSRTAGGLHSARIVLHSVDFAEIHELQHADRWEEAGQLLAGVARQVEAGGADFLLLATNTMHKVVPAIQQAISIPMLHIADATGARLQSTGIRRVGLLGTRFTMEENFYRGHLAEQFGLEVLVPDQPDQEMVNSVIFDELVHGNIDSASRRRYVEVINRLVHNGAEAIILGCTEITLLVGPEDTDVPLFDTTASHCEEAVALACAA